MPLEDIDNSKDYENHYLTKYIDIHKFLSLIFNKTLIFTRLDFYEDPYEGVKYKTLTDYQTYKDEPNNPASEDLEELQKSFREKKAKLEAKIAMEQKSQFSNSWFLSDRENIAMWNLYSNKDSVAIKVDVKNFIRNLENAVKAYEIDHPSYKYICGEISYNRLNPWNPYNEDYKLRAYSGFKKDIVFQHENEWRVLISIPEQGDLNYPGNLIMKYENILDIIEEVTTHPQMEEWKYKNIESLLALHKIENKLKRSRVYLKK